MKRSKILQILARRLSGREVEDIRELALAEMAFVQEAVLERLPNQPWMLETEVYIPLLKGETFIPLPKDYNGLMTHGGVWIAPATVLQVEYLTSKLYPIEDYDDAEGSASSLSTAKLKSLLQEFSEAAIGVAPTTSEVLLRNTLKNYEIETESVISTAISTSEISLRTILINYTVEPESTIGTPASVSEVSLKDVLIEYTIPYESVYGQAPSVSEVTFNAG